MDRATRRRCEDGRARGLLPRAVPGRTLRALVALGLLVPQMTGCFEYVPVGHAPIPGGAAVSVSITDRGRLALADPMGPGVRRIDGDLLEGTDTSWVLAVQNVEYLDLGVRVRWAGERVEVPREHVAELRERRFSRSRSVIMAGLVTAAAVAVSLIGIATLSGGDPGPGRPPDDNEPD